MVAVPGKNCGGARPNSGRKPGQVPMGLLEARREIKELLAGDVQSAVKTLRELCTKGKNEFARLAAAQTILERVYGKAVQPHFVAPPDPLQAHTVRYVEIIKELGQDERDLLTTVAERAIAEYPALPAPDPQGEGES